MVNRDFYLKDCKSVGVQADRGDISKPAVKKRPSEMIDDCYYKDQDLEKMDIRLADLSYYHGRGDNLLKDIEQECFIKYMFKILY